MTTLWDYTSYTEPRAYGDSVTYEMGLGWLTETCDTIEDWGAGLAYGKRYVPEGHYKSIDSSPSSAPFVDEICDLRDWSSKPDGIFMRHILEHNEDWPVILQNALASFTKRMVLVTFTPFSDVTHPMAGWEILDISFNKDDLLKYVKPYLVREEQVTTNTQFGGEHLFYLEKALAPGPVAEPEPSPVLLEPKPLAEVTLPLGTSVPVPEGSPPVLVTGISGSTMATVPLGTAVTSAQALLGAVGTAAVFTKMPSLADVLSPEPPAETEK